MAESCTLWSVSQQGAILPLYPEKIFVKVCGRFWFSRHYWHALGRDQERAKHPIVHRVALRAMFYFVQSVTSAGFMFLLRIILLIDG
jgi:hypothetical protein